MSHTCDYCNKPAQLVGGLAIYPHRPDLADLKFWQCSDCDAYVGCHKQGARVGRGQISDGTLPLGRLANAELRRWKSRAHAAFDPLWKGGGMTRKAAYSWLAHKLGIHPDNCHIGAFTVGQCRQAVEFSEAETRPNEAAKTKKLESEWTARWGHAA